MTIIITSGYFNPVHKGHIEYLLRASRMGELIIIVNSDEQVKIKNSEPFQDVDERVTIISALRFADKVMVSIDEDATVCKTIEKIVEDCRQKYGNDVKFVFAKGGDRNSGNIPEKEICDKYKIQIVDGLGEKIQSSSTLIENAKQWNKK